MKDIIKFVTFLWLFSIYTNCSEQLCEYSTDDGYKYNFEKLRKSDRDYEFIHERYTYRANFCGPLVSKCSNGPNVPAAYFLSGLLINYFSQ